MYDEDTTKKIVMVLQGIWKDNMSALLGPLEERVRRLEKRSTTGETSFRVGMAYAFCSLFMLLLWSGFPGQPFSGLKSGLIVDAFIFAIFAAYCLNLATHSRKME
jgi:hypothetical protein